VRVCVDMLVSLVVDEVHRAGLLKSVQSVCGRKREEGIGFGGTRGRNSSTDRSEWLLSRQPVRPITTPAWPGLPMSRSFINHTHTISTFLPSFTR